MEKKETSQRCANPVCNKTVDPQSDIRVVLQNGDECCGPACARACERGTQKDRATTEVATITTIHCW